MANKLGRETQHGHFPGIADGVGTMRFYEAVAHPSSRQSRRCRRQVQCLSPVTKAKVSPGGKLKAATGRTAYCPPVYSFAALPDDLSTPNLYTGKVAGKQDVTFKAPAKPTAVQKREL